MRYACVIGRRVMGDALSRLKKPTRDNFVGVALALVIIVYEAHIHQWSAETLWGDIWENVVAPCLLMLCGLFALHVLQSARALYKSKRISFVNARNGITSVPRWYFIWRCYVITGLYLAIPAVLFLLIWSPDLFNSTAPFTVDENGVLFLPSLSALNAIPDDPFKDKPPSLPELFKDDFPEDEKAENGLTMRGSTVLIERQIYWDFLGKSKFIGFYIPENAPMSGDVLTVKICEALPSQIRPMLERVQKEIPAYGGMGSQNATRTSDLVFTGLVIIYHQSLLTTLEKADIIRAFKSKNLDVQFRGPEYEAYRDSVWANSHKNERESP